MNKKRVEALEYASGLTNHRRIVLVTDESKSLQTAQLEALAGSGLAIEDVDWIIVQSFSSAEETD